MDKVAVYGIDGKQMDEIRLPESVEICYGRRCSRGKSGTYYKGAGIEYRGHLTNEPNPAEKILMADGCIYQKYTVIYPGLVKKRGIFLFRHQPPFSDYEGACGRKEQKITERIKTFELSAVSEIVDVIDTGIKDHFIYAYRIEERASAPKDVWKLFSYVLENDFNSAWDKNLWEDVEGYCFVRDLADWFVSGQFCHKLGTAYGLLSSIAAADKYLFGDIIYTLMGDCRYDIQYMPYLAYKMVRRFCRDRAAEFEKRMEQMKIPVDYLNINLYKELLQELYAGKACCHLENDMEWSWVRKEFMAGIPDKLRLMQCELQLQQQLQCVE